MRVQGVLTGLNANVDHFIDSRICFQVGLDGILVLDCCRISGNDDSQSHDPSMPRCSVVRNLGHECEKQRLMVLILTSLM